MGPYTVSIEIALPRAEVVERFDNPENLYKWQDGLQSFEHLSGVAGEVGAQSKMVYLNGKHRIELIETITLSELPERFEGTYRWDGGRNSLKSRFIEVDPNRTRWESTCEYEFKGFFLKLMGLVAPGMFRKQNQKFLDNFKAFCEEGKDVREA